MVLKRRNSWNLFSSKKKTKKLFIFMIKIGNTFFFSFLHDAAGGLERRYR
jgi:hypothetical protein